MEGPAGEAEPPREVAFGVKAPLAYSGGEARAAWAEDPPVAPCHPEGTKKPVQPLQLGPWAFDQQDPPPGVGGGGPWNAGWEVWAQPPSWPGSQSSLAASRAKTPISEFHLSDPPWPLATCRKIVPAVWHQVGRIQVGHACGAAGSPGRGPFTGSRLIWASVSAAVKWALASAEEDLSSPAPIPRDHSPDPPRALLC